MVTDIPKNKLFCVQQKNETHTGLEQLESKWWQNVHFWANYPFKSKIFVNNHSDIICLGHHCWRWKERWVFIPSTVFPS